MRQATQSNRNRQQVSNFISYQAPVGGWNSVDPLANMKPNEAIQLDNWYPRAGYCEIRGGSAIHAYTNGNTVYPIKTLAIYNGLNGTNKLFAFSNTGVYNVGLGGGIDGINDNIFARTDGRHQTLMFGDGTNNYLIAVNGVDLPLYYDGTTWIGITGASSPALTGVTTTSINQVSIHKGRLIFGINNSLAFYYLSSGVAGGALTKFDLSGIAQRGGYLLAMHSWSLDSGVGADDRMVFVTSEGEVIVYQGTNPSSASSWALVGVYYISPPLGKNCLLKVGQDLLILTHNGLYTLSSVVSGNQINYDQAVSRKIETTFNNSARLYGDYFGWSITAYPTQAALIINVPIAVDGEHHQYVMNSITKSWCRFKGWDAECFAVFNDELYMAVTSSAGDSVVIKAWTGASDWQNNNIDAYGKTSFSYFNKPGQLKQFKMFRPVLSVNGTLDFLVDIDVDFEDSEIYGTATYSVTSSAQWDVAHWDVNYWAAGLSIIKEWSSPSTWQGYCAAGKLKISTNSLNIQWMSTDYIFENGNGL